ncbi:GSCOCG00005459001-RA-CDS [Cotesia congregata]|nr:GSCOCG00005459001-RA-CDS [Cotesia congregata]
MSIGVKMRTFLVLFFVTCGCFAGSWDNNNSRCPPVLFPNGKVRSRGRGRIIRFNCFEGFTLVGNKYSTCVRGTWDTPTPVCVNSQCPTLATPDHALVASKYNGAILMYFCEPGHVLVGTAEIYCNGKQWNGTAPYCRDTTATAPTKCDFEKPDLCWWEQDPRHDFDWQRHNFETPSSHIGTGPTYDHTLGAGNDGYYLYIEASGRLTNDTARIISPLYNASYTDSGCFSFWYHMFGAGIGALRVYLKEESTETLKLMFEKRGDQDNRWLHGLFDLPKTNSSFQIIIEGVRGINYVSDIAIDDVAILQADECTQARRIDSDTTVRSVTDDDQIEIINALQSCRGRCGNIPGINTWTTIIPLSSPDACQCSLECAENSTCCPDFAEYCILGNYTKYHFIIYSVTDYPLSASTSEELNPTTKLNPLIITIDTKDEIDPEASNPPRKLSSPVTAKLTTSELGTTVKTRTRTTDKALHPETPFPTTLRHESPARTTESITVKIASKTTDSSINTISSESDVLVGRVEQLQAAVSFGLSEIISIVVVLIAAVAIATGIIIVVLRRRKTYKRGSGSSGSILSEDSDVRFLTSDEVLDFNLARPNEYDEI